MPRQPALSGALEDHAGGEQSVDLIGALEDAIDAGVAVGTLDHVVLVEAVAAVDLDSFVGDVVDGFRAEDFGDRALDGEFLDRFEHLLRSVGGGRVHRLQGRVDDSADAVDDRLGGKEADG